MIWGEKMKYNEKLFVDFLENLIKFNQKSSELIEKASAEIERRKHRCTRGTNEIK